MIDRREELERIGRERLEAEALARRDAWRRLLRACAEISGACVLGMVIMGFAFAVTDVELGRILLLGGMIVGYAGMAWALAAAYMRAKDAGDIE